MYGEPINALNRGISTFKEDVIKDTQASLSVELAIITFGDTVKLAQDFITVDEFNPPKLEASGVTPMGEAMEKALILLETRKRVYKENGIGYYRPWIFLITDGAPTDNWQIPAEMVREAEAQKRCLFFTVAVEGADMDKLKQIGDGFLTVRPVDGDLQLLFTPDKGEYINETTFITSSNAFEEMQVKVLEKPCSFICASTDGLEKVAINFKDWQPFPPFFNPLEEYMKETVETHEDDQYIIDFLNSERLNARTNDDKTLLLALLTESN